MKRVMLVFGTRPEAIKMAPLVWAMEERKAEFECITCVSAQHRQMLDSVLELFGIQPTCDLNVMRQGQTLFDLTVDVLRGLRGVFEDLRPDVVLVQGDTTTSFVGALAAFYERIVIGHVEAGLRTYQKYSPYPEEMNRQLTTRLVDWHFAPTVSNRANLIAEGISPERIVVTGNTVIDALHWVRDRIYENRAVRLRLEAVLASHGLQSRRRGLILVTGHRRESFGQGVLGICTALLEIAQRYPDIDIVYPVHLNPNVKEPVTRLLGATGNVHLIEPVDYEVFVYLMNECDVVLTDSGGVQEEAPSLGKPVLVMRDRTERPEAVETGTVRLVGTCPKRILSETVALLEHRDQYKSMATPVNPYGDGQASRRILDVLAAAC